MNNFASLLWDMWTGVNVCGSSHKSRSFPPRSRTNSAWKELNNKPADQVIVLASPNISGIKGSSRRTPSKQGDGISQQHRMTTRFYVKGAKQCGKSSRRASFCGSSIVLHSRRWNALNVSYCKFLTIMTDKPDHCILLELFPHNADYHDPSKIDEKASFLEFVCDFSSTFSFVNAFSSTRAIYNDGATPSRTFFRPRCFLNQ